MQIQLTLPKPHKAQAEIHDNLARFNVLCCGRRFGKDILQRNWSVEGMLAGLSVGWYEPTYKDTINNWDWICSTLQPLITDKSEQERRVTLATGGSLEMWSLENKDASRGRHYARVIINEAAKVPHLQYSWDYVIRITLMDLLGDAMICSTPRGYDFFQSLYQRGQDDKQAEWRSWQKSSWDNPHIPRSELAEAQRNLPEITYRQEIMAEFITSDGMVFRKVQEAAVLEPQEPIAGRQYIAGVDVAAAVDYTVITVMDVETKSEVYKDRFSRVDYNVLEDRLASVYAKYRPTTMIVETNGIGQPVIDHLRAKGIPVQGFTTTSTTKAAAIQNLQAAFEHSEIHILHDPVTIGELLSFEGKRTASGAMTYSAPSGLHDDTVMSLAIAWSAISMGNVVLFGA